jgi:hypothetical protein
MKRQKSIMIKIILFYYNLERKKDKKKPLIWWSVYQLFGNFQLLNQNLVQNLNSEYMPICHTWLRLYIVYKSSLVYLKVPQCLEIETIYSL